MNFIVKLVGSFLFTGYFPFAPATFASLVFCLIYFFVPGGEWLVDPRVVVGTFAVSIPVSSRLERLYGKDPSVAVIDEVVGMQVVLVLAEPTLAGVGVAFFLFRVFDVLKPPPVARSQTLPGGWGIVIDDLLAGLYTRVAMILIALLFPAVGRFI